MKRPEGWIYACQTKFSQNQAWATYVVDGLVVEKVGGNDLLDNLLLDVLAELLGGDIVRVLCGNDHGVHTQRNDGAAVLGVLNGDLGLGIGS